jgi:hypothetical protein
MDTDTQRLIERVHASHTMAVVVVTGAGSQALAWLLGVAGASRTVLEALVPYGAASFVEFVGHRPEQFVSAEAARDMARSAYRRAVHLRGTRETPLPNPQYPVPSPQSLVGIACTATIATDRPKRGEHRCYVAAWTASGVTTYGLLLVKGLRDRPGEEDVVSRLVLRALAEASGVELDLPLHLDDRERVEVESVSYEDPIRSVVVGHVSSVTIHPDGRIVADAPVLGGVLPGSFNPLHDGHERLAEVASQMLNAEVTFELSITNVDKPPLEEAEIRRRVAQFAGKGSVVVTHAPVYYEKARLFPGCAFVIGWDTAVRLVDPRYYGGSEAKMLMALEETRRLGCRFLVAGRVDNGVFRTLDDVALPQEFREMFATIPESAFRYDISSTQLRKAGHRL